MDTEKLLKVLRYGLEKVKHPETPQNYPYFQNISTGIAYNPPTYLTSKQVRDNVKSYNENQEKRAVLIEEFENFQKYSEELIQEFGGYLSGNYKTWNQSYHFPTGTNYFYATT